MQGRSGAVEHPPLRSHQLLEPLIAASTLDHDASLCCRPYDGPDDLGLPRERPEAMGFESPRGLAESPANGQIFVTVVIA